MKALVLAGGRGTRLRPITNTINKHLIPIAGKPMIFRVLDDLKDCGITDVIINLNKGDKEIPKAIGNGAAWGMQITYIEQEIPNGMMYPILMAENYIKDEEFVLVAGDNVLSGGLKKYYQTFLESDSAAHLLVTKVSNPERFGVAIVENGLVTKTVEKPKEFISDLAVTAIYFYRPQIFQAMKSVQPEVKGNSAIAEYYPPPAHQWLIDQGHKVTVSEVTGWWKDTGKPEALLEGNALAMHSIEEEILGDVHTNALIQGRVKIGKNTVIGNNVVMRGPVIVGENCKLQNCYLGPYTSLGNNIDIKRGEIENSIVMDGVSINTRERIVDSILGNNCTIMGTKESLPSGHKLVVGENTYVEL